MDVIVPDAAMQVFDRKCLVHKYKWEARKETVLKNKLKLDRTNGYEVLHFINEFFDTYKLTSHTTCRRAEYLMYNHLPININNKSEITSWLLKNWDKEF